MIGLALFAATAAASPAPASLKTFGDWIVGCDNGRACGARSLLPDDDLEALTFSIDRGAGAADAPTIDLTSDNDGVVALTADGKRLAVRLSTVNGVTRVVGTDAFAFIEGIKPAKRMGLLNAKGAEVSHASLSGLNAALLYMDEQQKRLGTVTALVRKGAKPASAVPATPVLPVIASPVAAKMAPRLLTKANLAAILKPLECEPEAGDDYQPVYARLDARTTLAIVPHPCGNGAYNYFSYAFLVDNAGKYVRARFDAPTGMGPDDDGTLVNADWDAKLNLVTTYAKGRGIGDCGSAQTFAWDGTRFRLSEQADMGECRGSTDYITTWRAKVVRR